MKFLKKTRSREPSPSASSTGPHDGSGRRRYPILSGQSADDVPPRGPALSQMAAQSHQPVRPHHQQQLQQQQHRQNVEVSPQYLSLSIENSTLRSQLRALLDENSAQSSLELEALLELANEKNEALQRKVDELHSGLIEIERERRLLRGSVERERAEYGRMEGELGAAERESDALRATLAEESRRAELLRERLAREREAREEAERSLRGRERYVKMKEKEISVLQIRVGEQERRIEVLVEEGLAEKRSKEGLAREKADLEEELSSSKEEISRRQSEVEALSSRHAQGQIVEEALRNELEVLKQCLEHERLERSTENERRNGREDELQSGLREIEVEMGEKDARLKEMEGRSEGLRVELEGSMGEKKRLKSLLVERERENCCLKEELNKLHQDMDRMSTCHEEVVSQKEEEIRALKGSNAEAEELRGELEGQIQIALEEKMKLASKCDGIEKERKELLGQLDDATKEMEDTRQKVCEVQQRGDLLEQELTESKSLYSQSKLDIEELNDQIAVMTAAHRDEKQEFHKRIAELESLFETTNQHVGQLEQRSDSLRRELTESKQLYYSSQAEIEKLNSEISATEAAHQEEKAHTYNIIASLETEFESTREQVDQMQQCEVALKQELADVKEILAQSQEEVLRLKDQIEELRSAREGEVAQSDKCIAELEAELKMEVETKNALRLKVDELYLRWKQESDASQEAIQSLEEDLAAERKRHQSEVERLQNENRAQVEEIEKDGAAVITDLEESIASLQKEIAETKLQHDKATSQLKQKISQAHTDKEILERQIKENEKRAASQEETILQLTNLSKHRGEEMIVLQKEVAQLRGGIDKTKREHASAMEVISNELDVARLAHESETKDLQIVIDDLRAQLNAANQKLANEDELKIAKSKLNERTNLLKEMVAQAKTYKADYEQESSRANQLNETLERYKSELSEAKNLAIRCEQEKNEKEKQFWDAMRKERDQRALMKKELESRLQSFDEVARRCSEMEKENVALKDKISRQENYIGRLQEKQADRRRAAAPLGISRANRPSTAGSVSGMSTQVFNVPKGASRQRQSNEARPGHRLSSGASVSEDYNQDENEKPAASKRAIVPQSPDELDLILG